MDRRRFYIEKCILKSIEEEPVVIVQYIDPSSGSSENDLQALTIVSIFKASWLFSSLIFMALTF